ncbi:tail fiber domain-containing protein [Streptomyces sp. STCH 565 A]|uniref:tail fiber domain-containing protein n=1 Tax=Streptomyces sp. STCH 565 A TaxID=2950532 RepID=UPI0020754357|nr:tail fiber domain-containing protein [Streptomyces sp. STCH 565 A]MCM8548815.1 tail fiber domain-containing protein [Streptomyces sp. STCH 565 A]
MSITSYPFDDQPVSEGQFSYLFRELQSTGVADQVNGGGFQVIGDSSGMQVKVNPGFALIRGHAIQSTDTEIVSLDAASTSTRIDRVVLRLDPAANAITLAVVKGTPGGEAPALTQSDTGVYEFPLASVNVGVGVATIAATAVTSERRFIGNTVGGWTSSTRPQSPRIGRLGLNVSTNAWEYWTGSKWADLAPVVTWASISGRPNTFTPSSHTHDWGDVNNKPTTYKPTAHTHDWDDVLNKPSTYAPSSHSHSWSSITSKPSTFPPSSHSHSWSSITSRPSTFPPSSHSHSGYLTSGSTIAWANGSKKPHNNSASGSGTWYAVWVEGNGTFCRNTSSIKFKKNVRDYGIDPDDVLALRPVIYDRKDQLDEETGEVKVGRKNEVGLIAEEVEAAGLNWLVNYLDGEVDGLRYDLLGVALVPVVQRQAAQIEALSERLAALETAA